MVLREAHEDVGMCIFFFSAANVHKEEWKKNSRLKQYDNVSSMHVPISKLKS